MSETTATVGRYLVIDVGCIECGESSGVVGTAETQAEADALAEAASAEHQKNWRGQHYFDVWDLNAPPRSDYAPGDPIEAP